MKITKHFLLNEDKFDGIKDNWRNLSKENRKKLENKDKQKAYLDNDGWQYSLYGYNSGYAYVSCDRAGVNKTLRDWANKNSLIINNAPSNPPHKSYDEEDLSNNNGDDEKTDYLKPIKDIGKDLSNGKHDLFGAIAQAGLYMYKKKKKSRN